MLEVAISSFSILILNYFIMSHEELSVKVQ